MKHSSYRRPDFEFKVRKPGFEFPSSLEKYWWGGNAFLSTLVNTCSLFFPGGEKFFIRSTMKFMDQIDDPKLLADVRTFMAQEVSHYIETEKYWVNLRDHGYDIDTVLAFVDRVSFKTIEPLVEKLFGPEANLAATAAFEHYTALLAEIALEHDIMRDAPEEIRNLWYWHAAEELEHKAVAFDVFQHVGGSYRTRMLGMAIATTELVTSLLFGTLYFLYKDGKLFEKDTWSTLRMVAVGGERDGRRAPGLARQGLLTFLDYLEPGFHPWQKNNLHLAEAVWTEQGL